MQDFIRQKHKAGCCKQIDEAMLDGPWMHPGPPTGTTQGPHTALAVRQWNAYAPDRGLGSSATQKKRRSATPDSGNDDSGIGLLSKHRRYSESTNSASDNFRKRNSTIWK
jgi:hypothetical protein